MDSKKSRRKSTSSSPAAGPVKSAALAIKRSDDAPVTLQGWLYKQGSDGLQLWKKRWFVLSEFCLFYYKGPDEEKQLGSILLPSYSVSPLSKDDGVYRKYAFKAEHANMRTYYFGAETKDSMIQWMNSLSLASILQNENNLRPEILARQLRQQGSYPPQMRHFPPPHRTLAPMHQYQQQLHQYQQQQHHDQQQFQHQQQDQPAAQQQHQYQQQHLQDTLLQHHIHHQQQQQQHAAPLEGEGRQPLYANAPPKPKRLNNSRDYSPSPDNSPERPTHESRAEDPAYPRHRLPQERRTPEAYGRSRFSREQEAGEQLEYEDVYNTNNNEEVLRYSRDAMTREQRHAANQETFNTSGQQDPRQYNLGQPGDPRHLNLGLPAAPPRPHSADFLEFERSHPTSGTVTQTDQTVRSNYPRQRSQPPRPKSSIGEIRRPDDFWSEQGYAQKMRESAHAYDPSQSRSQSRTGAQRASIARSTTLQNFSDQAAVPGMNLNMSHSDDSSFHPLQLSPARHGDEEHLPGQLPPPAFYQDNSPRDFHANHNRSRDHHPSPRGPYPPGIVYSPNQSYQQSPRIQNISYREDEGGFSQTASPRNHMHGHVNQQPGHVIHHQQQPGAVHIIQQQQHVVNLNQQQHVVNLNQQQHFVNPNQQQIHVSAQPGGFHPGQSLQHNGVSYPHQYPAHSAKLVQQTSTLNGPTLNHLGYIDNDTKITMPPSFPQPTPRKVSNPHTPTTYQNVPHNSKAHSDPRPLGSTRLETATPNRFQDRFESDRHSQDGDFRRSASARLPKQKARPGEYLNTTLQEEVGGDKTGEQREESMKRLLEWKQRMLQSPLTRKSSRNTSRTQTPTNSDSPVPSLHNDDIRKRVLEELNQQENSNNNNQEGGKDRKLSRKTSSGSRSSRSRSSPRIAPSKNSLYSSEDEEPESLRSRKRSKSTTTRSRNSSKESRRSQAKSKSSSGLDCYDPPEYINIEAIRQPTNREAGYSLDNSDWSVNSRPTNRDVGHSLDNSDWSSNSRPANMDVGHSLDNSDWSSNSRPTNKETGRSLDNSDWSLGNSRPEQNGPQRLENRPQEEWSRKPKISNAIGPDDWYRDDFSFDKSHPFMDDPVLLKQYAQILELKYRESSTDRLEQILQKPELLPPADFKLNMHEGRGDVTGMNNEEPVLRYPDSGYDTLKMNLRTERQNMCVDIEAEDSVVLRREGCQRDERKTQTWHSRNFADFQLLEKEGSTVFLSIEGQDTLQSPMKRSPREDKMNWSPNKSFQEIRREKEAPPKNVVKERLRSFESGREEDEPEQCPEVKKREPRMGRVRSKSVNYSAQDSEDEQFEEKKLEKKKSVKDLLSDFEKKSKELQDKEENYRGIGSYLLQDLKESDRRRVFSDTETLMYGTSSDEDNSDDLRKCTAESRVQPSPRDESVDKKRREEQKIVSAPPPLPPKKQSHVTEQDTSSTPTSSKEPFRIRSNSTLDQLDMVVELSGDVEDTYLAMTPSKSLTSLTGTPGRKTSLSMLSSRTSLSSHGSSQSITSQGLPRFGSDKNLGSMTPTEALIQSATGSVNHSRTPSQTLVMEHFQHASHFEEETYVDMNEDGSFVKTPRFREQRSQPILAKQSKKESLDTTLTGDSPESPRYCEISEPNDNAHYEYLYKARTPSAPQHYEVLYQEIEEQNNEIHGTGTIKENKRKVNKKPEPEPLRPIEGLPDILGNAPTNKGNTSSDADDESSKDFDIELKQQTMITLDDSFRPASFYLSHSSQPPNHDNGDESSDSDLVSPPPVPSSPPPMEEVLGYHASTNLEVSDLSGILSAAKSTFGRSRRDSQEDKNRRPSVSSKTSQGSHGSLNNGSQQSLNRDLTMSPHRLHGSHQSLSSRELPPIPGQSLLGSQQSLASKEIQSIGSRHPVENQEALRYSPYHSREGSLDNEMFLYHRFTQGSSLGDPYRKQSSDEFSSDTALYEQEYRKYHLENILEVSNTLERNDSHNTSVISQDLNISYNSVYDTRLQQSKVYKLEDHPALKKRKSLDERQNQPTKDQTDNDTGEDKEELSPRSKVPYYVSDILEEGGSKKSPRENMVDAITKSMNALDVESNSYFESKNEAEDERMRALRRSYTPDPYNSKGSETDQEVQSNVSRSKSLEGLLGDSPGSARDNLGYSSPAPKVYSPHNFNDISSQPRPARGHQPPPPPEGVPPLDIRPLASPAFRNNQEDDDAWADTLRRASLKHQAVKSPELKSKVDQEEVRRPVSRNEKTAQPRYRDDRGRQSVPTILNDAGQQTLPYRHDGRQSVPPHAEYRDAERSQRQPAVREERAKLPPPTAPKPKTPVHFERENSYNFNSAAVAEPIKRNTTVHNYHLNFVSTPERYNHQPAQPPHFLEVGLPTPTSSTTSEGPGRQARSATLPARIRYSDSSPRSAEPESPRTSKSGLQDPAAPVPPSPRGIDASVVPSSPRGIDTPVNLTPRGVNAAAHPYVRDHHGSAKENNMPGVGFNPGYTNQFGEPISREGSLGRQSQTEVQGPDPRQRRRSLSSNNKSQDLDNLKKRLGGSLSNMTAGDLLDKTQEELVLILIQLRRQATTLQETVDACKAELDNMRNTGEQGGTELRQHTWELEEQLARLNPVINLVDNMVKLGTLYRGNSNNNNSSSHSQTVRMKTQELAEEQIQRARKTNGNGNGGHLGNGVHHVDFDDLKRELTHVQTQLQAAQKKLESSSGSLVEVERDIFRLSQQLRVSGPSPRESVELSAHLRTLQQAARDLETRRAHTINIINTLRGREAVLVSELDPSGASSSHQGGRRVSAPNLNNRMTEWETPRETWLETDIDNNRTRDWGTEVANNINNKANFGGETATYMNQNFHAGPEVDPSYLNYRVEVALNPYEDDVATVHSEGVRSDYAPPLPDRGGGHSSDRGGEHSSDRGGEHSSDQEVILGLGELSEADERVQRYYGIIPRERNIEIKTVRMVKRDNKERGKIGRRGDDDSESVELSEMEEEEQTHREEEPPAPLPRGNYSNLHTFLSNQPYENNGSRVNMDEDFNKSLPRPQFKLGEYSTRRGPDSRPGSSMSAHERLFGVSRDESISPDMSPAKVSLASSDSSAPSALMSPVFKSAAARAIIEEERKTPMIIPKAKKKNRARRHMTVTGSQPAAVLEAISRHEKMEAVRSRDDIDLERGLRHAPDVVRSTYGQEDIRENSIDNLFGVPQKINIPLRYRPEQDIEDLSIEERRTRLKKADSIRRMLANTPAPANNDVAGAQNEREQLLALNQVLARQVMERSRLVAGQLPDS